MAIRKKWNFRKVRVLYFFQEVVSQTEMQVGEKPYEKRKYYLHLFR